MERVESPSPQVISKKNNNKFYVGMAGAILGGFAADSIGFSDGLAYARAQIYERFLDQKINESASMTLRVIMNGSFAVLTGTMSERLYLKANNSLTSNTKVRMTDMAFVLQRLRVVYPT